jgi:hypothetical protein
MYDHTHAAILRCGNVMKERQEEKGFEDYSTRKFQWIDHLIIALKRQQKTDSPFVPQDNIHELTRKLVLCPVKHQKNARSLLTDNSSRLLLLTSKTTTIWG